jgi:hypothetical protein
MGIMTSFPSSQSIGAVMLTPAEELGLSGLNLAGRVRLALYRIPPEELVRLTQRIREEATRRHLIYLRDGQLDTIHVLPLPLAIMPDQLAYIHYVSQTIHNALKRLPDIYLQDFTAREILRLTPGEEEWLWQFWGPNQREHTPIFGRLDAMIDFTSPMWKDSLRFVEPNLSGIGGLHLIPTSEQIIADVMLPALRAIDPQLQLEVGTDVRELLMQEALDHLEVLGRKGRNVCFVEPKYAGSGPDEQEALVQFYHDRYGLRVLHADPSELRVEGDEVYYNDAVIDLAYRDFPVWDLIALEEEGVNVEPMRRLFLENRVISSIAAELDQKSCWEVLTDPDLSRAHFSAEERQVFRRHILWTRIVSDRRTTLPGGTTGGLLTFVRQEREQLVLKPNRSFGGEGVMLGLSLSQSEWEQAVDQALADEERWVVQKLAPIPVYEFPVVGPDNAVHIEPFYTVMGFAPSKYGLAILARASQKQVVNVAQRGGMCVVMIGRSAARLFGPGAT